MLAIVAADKQARRGDAAQVALDQRGPVRCSSPTSVPVPIAMPTSALGPSAGASLTAVRRPSRRRGRRAANRCTSASFVGRLDPRHAPRRCRVASPPRARRWSGHRRWPSRRAGPAACQRGLRLGRARLDRVRPPPTGRAAPPVDREVHHRWPPSARSAFGLRRQRIDGDAQLLHQRGVAERELMALDDAAHADARTRFEGLGLGQREARASRAAGGGTIASASRVFAALVEAGRPGAAPRLRCRPGGRHRRDRTPGLPSVSVPVLSTISRVHSTQVLDRAGVAKQHAPCVGGAAAGHHDRHRAWPSPSAQGQAMISTATALIRPKTRLGCGPNQPQAKKVSTANGDHSHHETSPATRVGQAPAVAAFERCACATICTICDSIVCAPTRSGAQSTSAPLVLSVAPISLSPGALAHRQTVRPVSIDFVDPRSRPSTHHNRSTRHLFRPGRNAQRVGRRARCVSGTVFFRCRSAADAARGLRRQAEQRFDSPPRSAKARLQFEHLAEQGQRRMITRRRPRSTHRHAPHRCERPPGNTAGCHGRPPRCRTKRRAGAQADQGSTCSELRWTTELRTHARRNGQPAHSTNGERQPELEANSAVAISNQPSWWPKQFAQHRDDCGQRQGSTRSGAGKVAQLGNSSSSSSAGTRRLEASCRTSGQLPGRSWRISLGASGQV